jgi:ferredoxin
MTNTKPNGFLPRNELQQLLDVLQRAGHDVIGPTIHDGAICYRKITNINQLPVGYEDEQGAGLYRVHVTKSERAFGWANGAQAIKPILFRPRETLWQASHRDGEVKFVAVEDDQQKLAVIGARACDLAALKLHDAHFVQKGNEDKNYKVKRDNLFIVAVNCTHPSANCFCASTGDGPNAEDNFDLRLDELPDGFIVSIGSTSGKKILEKITLQPIVPEHEKVAEEQTRLALKKQTLTMPDLSGNTVAKLNTVNWESIAEKCISCGNCTSVCPTCFCSSQHDEVSLDKSNVEHIRQWDSCFNEDHSYIHGMVIRSETPNRYRQWISHKLVYWHEQYGRSGCVGCGRCTTWCPVAIDFVANANVIANGASQ